MKLLKIPLEGECSIIAVTDDADTVLTAGAFITDEDVEIAGNVLYTLLVRLGYIRNTEKTPKTPLALLMEAAKKAGNDGRVYEQNFGKARKAKKA